MAKLMVYPKFKSFLSTGAVNASGTVNTYITSTTTNKATYTDADQGTTNANPVVLDSSGEANIWLLTDAAYTFLIKDSAGSTIATIDDLVPISNLTTLENNLDTNGNSIVSASDRDINITPNGTGSVVLDGLKWPQADGTNGQVIQTDGSAQLSFATNSADLSTDSTPQLGGNLDTNAFHVDFDSGKGIRDESANEQLLFTTTSSAVNYLNITNAATGSAPIIEAKGTDAAIGITLTPKGSGALTLDGLTWPTSDGSANQVLETNGSGALSFATPGKFIQRVKATRATVLTATTQVPLDDTIPQNTEGDELLTLAVTPAATDNRLLIRCLVPFCGVAAGTNVCMALFQDSTAGALAAVAVDYTTSNQGAVYLEHEMAAGTTSSTTFKIRIGPDSATTVYTLSDDSIGTRAFGGIATVVLTIDENDV